MLCFVFCPPRIYVLRHSRLALQGMEEGSNYLHRNPASRKMRRKGNPEPGGITGPPCSSGGYIYGGLVLQVGEYRIWDSNMWSWVLRDSDLRIMRWRGLAAVVNGKTILSSERILSKDYDRRCSNKKHSGREPQGAWRQDKLSGSKPRVVK
jgi:hypothetical protein